MQYHLFAHSCHSKSPDHFNLFSNKPIQTNTNNSHQHGFELDTTATATNCALAPSAGSRLITAQAYVINRGRQSQLQPMPLFLLAAARCLASDLAPRARAPALPQVAALPFTHLGAGGARALGHALRPSPLGTRRPAEGQKGSDRARDPDRSQIVAFRRSRRELGARSEESSYFIHHDEDLHRSRPRGHCYRLLQQLQGRLR
jgi:hypothetical protein